MNSKELKNQQQQRAKWLKWMYFYVVAFGLIPCVCDGKK